MDRNDLIAELTKLLKDSGATAPALKAQPKLYRLLGAPTDPGELVAAFDAKVQQLGNGPKARVLRHSYGLGLDDPLPNPTQRRQKYHRDHGTSKTSILKYETQEIERLADLLLFGQVTDADGRSDDQEADERMPELDSLKDEWDLPEVVPLTEEELLAAELQEARDREAELLRLIAEREAQELLDEAGFSAEAVELVLGGITGLVVGVKEDSGGTTSRFLDDGERSAIVEQLRKLLSQASGDGDINRDEALQLERRVLDSPLYSVEDWVESFADSDMAEEQKRHLAETIVSYRREHRRRQPVQLDAATRRLMMTIKKFVEKSHKEIDTQIESQRLVSTAAADVIATAEEWMREVSAKRRPNRKQVATATRLLEDAHRLDSNAKSMSGAVRGYGTALVALSDAMMKFVEDADPDTAERVRKKLDEDGS